MNIQKPEDKTYQIIFFRKNPQIPGKNSENKTQTVPTSEGTPIKLDVPKVGEQKTDTKETN